MTIKQNQFTQKTTDHVTTSPVSTALKWAVFVSGNGSNLQALLDAEPKIHIAVVVSNKAEAFGVERARRASVPVVILPATIDWEALSAELEARAIDRIFLAGFMKVIPPGFIHRWADRILNLHPSLLPEYKGLRAIERSYSDRAAMGVTIHWVTADLDAGPILLQREVFAAGAAGHLSLEEAVSAIHRAENEMVVAAVRRCEEC